MTIHFKAKTWAGVAVASIAIASGVVAADTTPAGATTYAYYHTTTDVSSRSTPTAAPTSVYGAPSGATIAVQCQVIGQPVGPYGNTLYFLVIYANRTFYVPDTYTDSPHLAGQPPIAGIPMCGSTTPPPASTDDPAVWVGMPFTGRWPNAADCSGAAFPSELCSLPSVHHNSYGGDFAMDLQGVSAGAGVYLYAAPKNTALNNSISAQVTKVGPACANGNVSWGGYQVQVSLFYNGANIGHVTYAHVNPTVSQGQWISRWGSQVGTVGSYYYNPSVNGCWQGVHTHFELFNTHHYACYRPGVAPGAALSPTNYLGYVGGNYASSQHQACPSGI